MSKIINVTNELATLSSSEIFRLNAVGKNLVGGLIIPVLSEQAQGKDIIERIVPPYDDHRVNMSFTRNVMIALCYAISHSHYKTKSSMLNDIKANKRIYISSYLINDVLIN